MAYKWNFVSVGGTTRVRMTSGEDIRHLGELDKKMWTVLSCPVIGLEMDERSLRLMDVSGDGLLHVEEVIASGEWLCQRLHNVDGLLRQEDYIAIDSINDEAIAKMAKQIAPKGQKEIHLSEVEAVMAAATVDEEAAPAAPYADEVMAAYKEQQDAYTQYFRLARLQKVGLATIPEDMAKPGLSEKEFVTMGEKIAAYDQAKADVTARNAAAVAAVHAPYQDLYKLLLLHRDFYKLLRNFVTWSDFYDRQKQAIFQAGTLIIDQRACYLCIQVNDMAKQNAQAAASGMFLVYCDCVNKVLSKTMTIVAAVTAGDIKNLTVGKNAIFYDRQGNDWDATVVKVIDNPISIKQAFWSPYRKLGQWITDLVNKSAAEKDKKMFDDITTQTQEHVDNLGTEQKKEDNKPQPFDIAKFAGIFAAIGMAVGYIGSFLSNLAGGINSMPWYNLLAWIVGLILVVSGPSMLIAAIKLHRRNLAPILNANGWAINADAMVNVLFGATLTEQVQFPMTKLQDPFKRKMSKGRKWAIAVLSLAIVTALFVMVWLAAQDGHCPIELFHK